MAEDNSTIATAYVQLIASAAGLSKDIENELGASGDKNGSSFGSTFLKSAGAAIAAGAAAVAGTVASVWKTATDTAAAGDEIAKSSVKLGVTAEQYQALAFAAEHCDFEVSNLLTAQRTLMKSGFDGSMYDALNAVMALGDEEERTALATKLFGDRATIAMANLINGSESLDDFKTQLEDLGGMMSGKTVSDSARFQDAMTNISSALDGLKVQMVGGFLPGITLVTDGLAEFIGGNESGLGKVNAGIDEFIRNLTNNLPKFLDFAGNILVTLGNGILKNLPVLGKSAIAVVGKIGSSIISSLPEIGKSAISVVSELASSIISSLPMLGKSAISITKTLVDALRETFPQLITTAVEAIIELAKAITEPATLTPLLTSIIELIGAVAKAAIEAIPLLLDALPTIIGQLISSIIEFIPEFAQVGMDLLLSLLAYSPEIIIQLLTVVFQIINEIILYCQSDEFKANMAAAGQQLMAGLASGITNAWDTIKNSVTGVCTKIYEQVCDIFDINSPSKVFFSLGNFLGAGLANGISDSAGLIDTALDDVTDEMQTTISADVVGMVNSSSVSAGAVANTYDNVLALLSEYLPVIASKEPVELSPNTERLFDLMRKENQKFKAANRVSGFI